MADCGCASGSGKSGNDAKADCITAEPTVRDVIKAVIRRRLICKKYHNLLKAAMTYLQMPVNYDEHEVTNAVLQYEEKKLDCCDHADIQDAIWTNDDRILKELKDGWERYRTTVNQLFDGRVDWSRIVVLLVFTAVLCEASMEHENVDRIPHIIQWCACYVREKNLDSWIDVKGGWSSLICELAPSPPPCLPTQADEANAGKNQDPCNSDPVKALVDSMKQIANDIQPATTSEPPKEAEPAAANQDEIGVLIDDISNSLSKGKTASTEAANTSKSAAAVASKKAVGEERTEPEGAEIPVVAISEDKGDAKPAAAPVCWNIKITSNLCGDQQ